jgi:hypothetical protein
MEKARNGYYPVADENILLCHPHLYHLITLTHLILLILSNGYALIL